jgi:hypothetical protein
MGFGSRIDYDDGEDNVSITDLLLVVFRILFTCLGIISMFSLLCSSCVWLVYLLFTQ